MVVKFILLMSSTNAISERSISAVWRMKTYLRTMMTQQRMNNIMILHINKQLTDTVNHKEIFNNFITTNDERHKHFGIFS